MSSDNGRLHFYQLYEQSPVQIELAADSPDGVCNGDLFHNSEISQVKAENDVKEKGEKKSSGTNMIIT